jgi:RNA polymerase sigma factor (sigma-70 family)
MDAVLGEPLTTAQQDRLIALTVQRERPRLLAYLRRRIADAADAEDIVQDALYELLVAYRMLQPVEQAGAWLARVARNRLVDSFRRRGVRARRDAELEADALADLLPAPTHGPEAAAMRAALLQRLEAAIAELPDEQRAVFVAHELDGVSFSELAARSGVSVNTLLSRKHYATRFLRRRLRDAWEDWTGMRGEADE